MSSRFHLTPEIVNMLAAPTKGDLWIADAKLRGFGVRLWANSNGGNTAYAIRVRDQKGIIKRETFSVWDEWRSREKALTFLQEGVLEFPLGIFLDDARNWATVRIRELKGQKTRAECRESRRQKLSAAFQAMSLEAMAERILTRLEKQGRSDNYVIQLRKLFWSISETNRKSLPMEVNVEKLAGEIAKSTLPVMQSRALQSFVGQLYSNLRKWHGPAGQVIEEINQNLVALRTAGRAPHPRILDISDQEISMLFSILSSEKSSWREALAIWLYFETGAKLRRVLRIRWSEILDKTWYPYSPSEREYWFMGSERLNDTAQKTLSLALTNLSRENRQSTFVFPRIDPVVDKPIANIRRYWIRVSKKLGWDGLPLSHIVRRYKSRNTPSYLYMYTYFFVPIGRSILDPGTASKLADQEKNIIDTTYYRDME